MRNLRLKDKYLSHAASFWQELNKARQAAQLNKPHTISSQKNYVPDQKDICTSTEITWNDIKPQIFMKKVLFHKEIVKTAPTVNKSSFKSRKNKTAETHSEAKKR